MSPRGMRRRGDGLECSPLCPALPPHSPHLASKRNMYQDPIHPGAEFIIPMALARSLEAEPHNSALQTPALGRRGGPATCPLNAHLCTATSMTTAHHDMPASPCIVRHHLPAVEPLHSHGPGISGNCGGPLPCRGCIAHRTQPPGACAMCSTCDTTPLLPCTSHPTSCSSHPHSIFQLSNSSSPLLLPSASHPSSVHPCSSHSPQTVFTSGFSPGLSSIASISQLGHIPPPVMFQKPSTQVHIPAMQTVANIGDRGSEAGITIGGRGTGPAADISASAVDDWPNNAGSTMQLCSDEEGGPLRSNFTDRDMSIDCQGCTQQPLINFSRSPSGVAVSNCQQLQELTVSSASNAPRRASENAPVAPDQSRKEIDDERLTESRV